jgi:hypothetical protein
LVPVLVQDPGLADARIEGLRSRLTRNRLDVVFDSDNGAVGEADLMPRSCPPGIEDCRSRDRLRLKKCIGLPGRFQVMHRDFQSFIELGIDV